MIEKLTGLTLKTNCFLPYCNSMAIIILIYENHYFIYLTQTLPQQSDIHAHTLFLECNSIFLKKCQILLKNSEYTDLLCPNPTETGNHECISFTILL